MVGRSGSIGALVSLGVFFLPGLVVVWAQSDAVTLTTRDVARVDTSRLLTVEQAVLPPVIAAGPAAHKDLTAYYLAANPQLCERLETAKRAFEDSAHGPRPYRALTLIAGDAGVGKTFLKGQVFSGKYPKEAVFKFDIREIYETWQQEGTVELRPDLRSRACVLSQMLAVGDPDANPLQQLLASKAASFYVIDSLDELHPDEYERSLRQIEAFATSASQDFVHVVVFARPFAFVDYWQHRAQETGPLDVALFMLAPPQFRTTGDLLVSNWNYVNFKFKAQFKSTDGKLGPLSLEDYVDWEQSGFDRTGRFAHVVCEAHREIAADVFRAVGEYAQQYRVFNATLYNLAGNSVARKIVADRVARGKTYNERDFMNAYFDAWLERDYASDKRPCPSHPEHLDLYLRLLENVAVHYLQQGLVDEQGFFPVTVNDRVEIDHDGERLSFPTQQVLNRSGMKHLDPLQLGGTRYRFEPVWFHRLLVERFNGRTAKEEHVAGRLDAH